MFTLGAAPDLEAVFKDAADRDAARDLMEISERLTPTVDDEPGDQVGQTRN